MRRRSKAGGEPVKTRRRKAVTVKRRNALKAARRRSPSIADLQEQLDRRTRERDEAHAQQTATADVLKVISRSTFDLQAVLDTLVQSAARLCEADRSNIWRPSGDAYKIAAAFGLSPDHEEVLKRRSVRPGEIRVSAERWRKERRFISSMRKQTQNTSNLTC